MSKQNVVAAEAAPLTLNAAATALMVIDMQNGFLDDQGFMAKLDLDISRCKRTIGPIRKLIDAWHETGGPVIFTRLSLRADYKDAGQFGVLFPGARAAGGGITGTWDAEIVDELRPIEGDIVVDKTRYSAFYNTNMEVILRSLDVKTVVVTGVTTNICVESTIRDAFFRDYPVILPTDATAAITQEMEDGPFLTMKYGFGRLATTDELVRAVRAGT